MRTIVRLWPILILAWMPLLISADAQSAGHSVDAKITFKRGVVVKHWLTDNLPASMAKNSHYGADWFDREDVAWIAGHGFDHLRIWISGHEWVDAEGNLIDSKIAPFERALRDARESGLGVVLAMHSLPRYRANIRGEAPPANSGSPFTDASIRTEAENLWLKVARRFNKQDGQLRFELINQPDAESAGQMREFNRIMLATIRKADKQRVVYIGGRENELEFIEDAELPDANTALAITFREPAIFAYQYQPKIPSIRFPGRVPNVRDLLPADDPWQQFSEHELTVEKLREQIRSLALKTKRFAGKHEVYVHNIGVMTARVDADSVRTYMQTVREGLEKEGLAWAVYDYHSGCAVRAQGGTAGPSAVLEGLGIGAK